MSLVLLCGLVWKLLFDIFDVDTSGKITMAELDAMLRMLYGSPDADPGLLELLAVNGSDDGDVLTFDDFLQVCRCFFAVRLTLLLSLLLPCSLPLYYVV